MVKYIMSTKYTLYRVIEKYEHIYKILTYLFGKTKLSTSYKS